MPADLRNGILCAGIRNADQETWNKTLDKYTSTKDSDKKAEILNILGCATSEEIVQNFLLLSIEEDHVIDVFTTLDTIYEHNLGCFDIVIDFILENIDKIIDK